MLNELHSLSATLESKNISIEVPHDDYGDIPKVNPKAPCIRIWLAKDGSICEIESISAELAQSLRKYGNNQGSFPAFNIVPLYRITDKKSSELEQIEKENTLLDLDNIKALCDHDNWKKSVVDKVNGSLHDFSLNMLKLIGERTEAEYYLISELARLASNLSNEPNNGFRDTLEKCVFSILHKQENINLALSILFHKGNPKKSPKDDTGTLSVVLDLLDWKQYCNYPVTSEHTTKWINTRLIESDQESISRQAKGREKDAFNAPFVAIARTMPSVRLSGFDITLRSMFKGQPCQSRYRKIEDSSYPITLKNRSLAKKSLLWLAKTEHKGVMWQKVDKNEIVFVYPSKLPDVPPKFASIFGSSQAENSTQTEARFENIAKKFIKAFRGIPPEETPDSIQIFTIRKMDKARSKVIFTRNCSPEQLIYAAESWEKGCLNSPETDLGEQIIPFPLQVASIVNNVWKQNGELAQGKTAVERMKYYQGMELLLDLMQENMISNYLHILLSHSSGLVNHIGNLVHGWEIYKDKKELKNLEKSKKETILLLSVIGLLLYKHNDRKEKYMENMAYLVGQLLKVSDELHTLYCKVMRKGDIPPQLAGSALFVTTGEMPYQAIAQLSVRMNPYITWAKQYRFNNKNEEKKNVEEEKEKKEWKAAADRFLKLFEEVANKLKPIITESTRFNDYEKAQLFIGYLASFPK